MAGEFTQITETISVVHHQITEEDKEIAHEYNLLVRSALVEARRMLKLGTPDQKLRIITGAMSAAGKLAQVDSKVEIEQARREFEGIVSDMTGDISERPTIITGRDAEPEKEYIDVEIASLPRSIDYQGDQY